MGLDYSKYRKEIRGGTSHREMSRDHSEKRSSRKLPFGTYTTREGEINKIFDLYKQKEVISKKGKFPKAHREKTKQELYKLKESRKSDKHLESTEDLNQVTSNFGKQANSSKHRERRPKEPSSESDNGDPKQSFMRMKSHQNSRPLLHEQNPLQTPAPNGQMRPIPVNNIQDPIFLNSNPASLQSDRQEKHLKNPFTTNKMPQSRSEIRLGEPAPSAHELGLFERSKSRPIAPKIKTSMQIRRNTHLSSQRSRTQQRKSKKQKGFGRSSKRYDRGLSANLSGLAQQTVMSYEGPNVSVVSRRLREKRTQILDTFAQLNLDMAWVHKQCKYIDLHSTDGVLKFFELQNRLIVKLATKLRKEKSSRFRVEKQCEQLIDKFKEKLEK